MEDIWGAIKYFSYKLLLDVNEARRQAAEFRRQIKNEPTPSRRLIAVLYFSIFKVPRWVLASSVGATIVTLLGVWAGILGSVYSTEIGASWPLGSGTSPNPERVHQFYWFLIVFTILYITRKTLVESSLRRREEKLVTVLQTMPPAGTLFRFEQVFKVTSKAVHAGLEELSRYEGDEKKEYLEQLIRIVLQAILNLAHAFDGQPRCRYAANVMIFRASSDIGASEIDRITSITKFISNETDIYKLKGILELRTPLSTTTDDAESPQMDESLLEMALPVPKELVSQTNGLYNCLPGAPLAFMTLTGQIVEDTLDLWDWVSENCNLPPETADQIQQYFQSDIGQRIRSIFSYAILEAEGKPIGVINIHSDRPRLFNVSVERSEQFQALSVPLLQLLVICLTRLIPGEAQ